MVLASGSGLAVTDILCPRCGSSVDEHPSNACLDGWVAEAIFDYRGSPPFRYSTDIVAAWQVVEKMRYNGWTLSLDNECAFDCWSVIFEASGEMDEEWGEFRANAPAPLAICRAALKATGQVIPMGSPASEP